MLRIKDELGATMVEFSLVIGLLLIVIFSLIEGSRYIASLGILYNAADRAVAVAASDYRLTEPRGSAKYNEGVQAVQKAFNDSLAGSWIGLGPGRGYAVYLDADSTTLGPKVPTSGSCSGATSDEDALLNCPVEFEFYASMKPLVPCAGVIFSLHGDANCNSPVPIHIVTAAYKEPYKALTIPSPIDCKGRTPSAPGYGTDCACDVDQYWDATDGCVCYSAQKDADGKCLCPQNWGFNTVDKRCSTCTLPPSSCSVPGMVVSPTTCACICDSSAGRQDDGNGGCDSCINSSQTLQNDVCACPAELKEVCDADPTKVLDPLDCTCKCRPDLTDDGAGSCHKCLDENRKYENDNCDSCVKTNADCSGTDGKNGSLDPTTCQCVCNGSGAGYCELYGGTFDPKTCSCNCGPGATWQWAAGSAAGGQCFCAGDGMVRVNTGPNAGTCQCQSAYGLTSDGAGGCKCIGGSNATKIGSGQYTFCQCTNLVNGYPPNCPNINGQPGHFDYTTCQCGC